MPSNGTPRSRARAFWATDVRGANIPANPSTRTTLAIDTLLMDTILLNVS